MSNSINLLAIDTTTDACSAAILSNGNIFERYEIAPRRHAKLILSMIDSLLKEAHLDLRELDALAFGRGPGSFTGIRIACSVVQGIGFALEVPIIPVSTLRALAQGAYRESEVKQVFAILDARMQEFYWGLFRIDEYGIMQSVSKESVQPFEQIQLPEGLWHPVRGFPRAADIIKIARLEFELGQTCSADQALPVYIRDEVAKKTGC